MAKVHTPAFGPVIVRLSQVSYACDLTTKGGKTIPLGVTADLSYQNWFGLGLRARVGLRPDELGYVGRQMQKALSEPFKLLHADYQRVRDAELPGHEFINLQGAYSSVLYSAPTVVEHKLSKKVDAGDEEALKSALRAILIDVLADGFDDHVVPDTTTEDFSLRPAA